MAKEGFYASLDWRGHFVERQCNVLEHYQQVLRRPLPAEEREAILRRVARVESEIHALGAAA